MKIHDRGNHWHIYDERGFGLTIDATYADYKGIITSWELYIAPDNVKLVGNSKEDFIKTLKNIIKENDLKHHSKATKDLIVIYTDNILKIRGFFREYITNEFNDLYIQLLDYIEFREISKWKDLITSKDIAEYAKYLVDYLFIPNEYWFLTPNQVPRRAIAKACNDNIVSQIYPTSFLQYSSFRKALFGGICYVPYRNLVITDPVMCLDLTSAYIYDLLIEKHCMSKFNMVNENNYEYYLDSNTQTSIGSYTISYSCSSNKIHCFKSIDGVNYETGTNTVESILTSVDLKTLISIANVHDIKCNWLYACDLDVLPKYFRDEVVKQYIKKVDLKDDKIAYDLQKPVVNGIFGDCIRNYDEKGYYEAKRNPSVAPQWGIWCTSYAKKNLLKLANKVEGWVYSDTDSIYCFDNDYNRKLLEEYNNEARAKVKVFCDTYGYDYEKLKDLGTFKIEKQIKKFKAITQKVYMYETIDGEFKLTAAGLDQSTIDVSKDLFNSNHISYGKRLFKFITEDSYYEEWKGGIDSILLTTLALAKMKEQY